MSDSFDAMKDLMRKKLRESVQSGQQADSDPPPSPSPQQPQPPQQLPQQHSPQPEQRTAGVPRETPEVARQVRHHMSHPSGMILTNIETVPGMTIVEHFGLVNGSMVRAKHVGTDIMASLKNLVGGELGGYSKLLDETRGESIDRMVLQARQLGANAIVNVRFSTSSVAQGAAELYVYGTAVRVE